MATKVERLQRAWHKFDNDKDHKPTGTRQAVEWAVAEVLIELPDVDPRCAGRADVTSPSCRDGD
jgi:hypothetical protein